MLASHAEACCEPRSEVQFARAYPHQVNLLSGPGAMDALRQCVQLRLNCVLDFLSGLLIRGIALIQIDFYLLRLALTDPEALFDRASEVISSPRQNAQGVGGAILERHPLRVSVSDIQHGVGPA